MGSANYTERRSASAPYLSRPTDKNDAKWRLNGTANKFVSGPSFFTCVVAYTCLPEATVPKPQNQQSATAPIASRKIYTWCCHLIRHRTGGARDTEHWCKVAREQYLGLRFTRLHPHVAVAHETVVFLPSAQTKACGEQHDLRDHCRHHPNWKHVILEEGRLGDVTNSRK